MHNKEKYQSTPFQCPMCSIRYLLIRTNLIFRRLYWVVKLLMGIVHKNSVLNWYSSRLWLTHKLKHLNWNALPVTQQIETYQNVTNWTPVKEKSCFETKYLKTDYCVWGSPCRQKSISWKCAFYSLYQSIFIGNKKYTKD